MKKISRNVLKYIAILAMLMDHLTVFLPSNSPLYFIMRFLGRLTAPIMCFFIAEGFYYTHSTYKYGLRLGIFALISQLAYTFFNEGTLFTYRLLTSWNVIFTLLIGFCALLAYEKIRYKPLKWIVIGLLCIVSFVGDWRFVAPLWILFFYIFRESKKNIVVFSVLAALEVLSCIPNIINDGQLWQIGVFFVVPLLLLYNGKKGSNNPVHKWAFYLFYPLHLFVLGIIKCFILVT